MHQLNSSKISGFKLLIRMECFKYLPSTLCWFPPPQVQAEFMSPTARAQIELWFHLHSFLQTRMKLICFSICCTILGHQNQNFSHKQKIEIRLLNYFFFTFARYVCYKKVQSCNSESLAKHTDKQFQCYHLHRHTYFSINEFAIGKAMWIFLNLG